LPRLIALKIKHSAENTTFKVIHPFKSFARVMISGKSMGIMIMSPTMVNVIQTRWLRYALLLQIKCSLWAEVLL
jgi:hypothetical protein